MPIEPKYEAIIAARRSEGLSALRTMMFLIESHGLSKGEAKRLVYESETWAMDRHRFAVDPGFMERDADREP